jgi:hypothetical protein
VVVQDSTESEIVKLDAWCLFMERTHVVKGSLKFAFDSR